MIPYKIHHIWLQGGIPEKYQENYDKWDAFLIDWDHRVWDEESLLSLCTNKQVEEYMKIETLINKVNYLKYILMYNEGGIFSDLDSYPVQDLYKFFVQDKVEDINIFSGVLDQRYPYNTGIPEGKPFGDYDVIIGGRNTLAYYPDGRRCVLLDNSALIGVQGNSFWIDMIDWMGKRTNLKSGALSDTEFLPHEPYGPYGMSDYLYNNFENPYLDGILIIPELYIARLESNELEKTDNVYIVHSADSGW